MQHPNIIDARRANDNLLVCIKRVSTKTHEVETAMLFSQPALRSDPRNHCIPILDVIPDEQDEYIAYLVMPFYRMMDDPPFELVDDVLDFADQVLEVSRVIDH